MRTAFVSHPERAAVTARELKRRSRLTPLKSDTGHNDCRVSLEFDLLIVTATVRKVSNVQTRYRDGRVEWMTPDEQIPVSCRRHGAKYEVRNRECGFRTRFNADERSRETRGV